MSDHTPDQAFAKGKSAFTRGDLETALKHLEYAYDSGLRAAQLVHVLSQTLQRLSRYEDAIYYLEQGLRSQQRLEDKALLINLKAQIYSSRQQWNEAAGAYKELLRTQTQLNKSGKPAQRRFTRIQLAIIYGKLGQVDDATQVLNDVLKETPQDQQALRILSSLTIRENPVTSGTSEDVIEVELPDERINLVSPMLQRDIELADYRDEQILRRGNPTVDDANRLLREAEKTKNTEFIERYPIFLEAAKAFSELSELSYELEHYYRALARYAMFKGGALVSQFQRELTIKNYDLGELRRIRDSATSYYLEALVLQTNVDPRFVLVSLTNHLYIQLSYEYTERGQPLPANLVKARNDFSGLLLVATRQEDEAVTYIVYASVVAWGGALGRIWNQLAQVSGGPAGTLGDLLTLKKNRHIPYKILSRISGQNFSPDEKPGTVLSTVFSKRREQLKSTFGFFLRVQQIPFKIENFRRISEIWPGHEEFTGVFLDTDSSVLKQITEVLTILAPYQNRSINERTSILVTVRNSVSDILDFIEQNTTYWGRVSFEPLLLRWQSAIRNIEEKRSEEVQPNLQVTLEPEVFNTHENQVVGSLVVKNNGRGTADKFVVKYRVSDHGGNVLFEDILEIENEVRVDSKDFHQITFPIDVLPYGTGQSYALWVQVTPYYRGVLLDADWINFTLEIASTVRFGLDDIIWDELRIPEDPRMFVGRDEFIQMLGSHLRSNNRARTYILVGLTRTGKSSILTYLARKFDFESIIVNKKPYQLLCFIWDLAKASAQSNAGDMWAYLLEKQVVMRLWDLANSGLISSDSIPSFRPGGSIRLKDWDNIVDHLHSHKFYPVFLIDEFSHYKNLVDKQRIDSSFLAKIRSDALEDRASFIFAGTYDLRKLIQDQTYGITGQLVNATQKPVSSVSEVATIELIEAMGDKLIFTPDAKELIMQLSGRIPYFTQLICKRCAEFAYFNSRNYMGPAEVNNVVKALTGEIEHTDILPIDSSVFMNNMIMVGDPPAFEATLTTICDLVRGEQNPRFVAYSEIITTWDNFGIKNFQRGLSNALRELKDREVLIQVDDEGQPAYKINVDLFRRWWSHEYQYLKMSLDNLREEDD